MNNDPAAAHTFNLQRWQALMQRLAVAEHRAMYEALDASYRERHRFYHTVAHIDYCLARLDEAVDAARSAEEVEAALWFHDAIYNPRSRNNELKSAEMAFDFLTAAGVAKQTSARVRNHVLATAHNADPSDRDSALVIDIDLAILGAPPTEYALFETNVRREYKWVPGPIYRSKRREILESFLLRTNIYFTDCFRNRYESQATINLRAAIDDLK